MALSGTSAGAISWEHAPRLLELPGGKRGTAKNPNGIALAPVSMCQAPCCCGAPKRRWVVTIQCGQCREREAQGLDWRWGPGKPSCRKELRLHTRPRGVIWREERSQPQAQRQVCLQHSARWERRSGSQDTGALLTPCVAQESNMPSLGLSFFPFV